MKRHFLIIQPGRGSEPQLWLHQFRQFWFCLPLRVSIDDSGLLGKLVSGEHAWNIECCLKIALYQIKRNKA